MKLTWLELINDWWVMLWFAFGIAFWVIAIVLAFNAKNDRAVSCVGIALACHARCEVKILQKKMEKINGNDQ